MDDTARQTLARDILAHLDADPASAPDLLDRFPPDSPGFAPLWRGHPELYDAFTARLVAGGHPARALDLALDRRRFLAPGLADDDSFPIVEGYRLRFNLVLAAARGGNSRLAEALLRPLLEVARGPDPEVPGMPLELRVDVAAQGGRVLKEKSRRDPALLGPAARAYEAAADLPGVRDRRPDLRPYPLVNAATLWRLAAESDATPPADRPGCRARSEELAREVLAADAVLAAPAEADWYWRAATAAEACVLAGAADRAAELYPAAVRAAAAAGAVGDMVAIGGNLRRLAAAGVTEPPDWVEQHVGGVVAFAGHMVDSPDRAAAGRPPRFPDHPGLVKKVSRAIADALDRANATVGFCSLASGADILFARAMLYRGAELHVVLPYAEDDFLRTSVHFGLPDDPGMRVWALWFREVLARVPADRRHFATTEPYLRTRDLLGHVNAYTQGLAVLRARQRLVTPRGLVVMDPGAAAEVGGTRHFHDTWAGAGFPAEVIDLAALRDGTPAGPPRPPQPAPEPLGDDLTRSVKAVLFADVAGFSRLGERDLHRFLSQYARVLKGLFGSPAGEKAVYANTWGDGLHAVFGADGRPSGEAAADAAEFALSLLERAADGVRWADLGMGRTPPLRVALHLGPVFELRDLFQDRRSYSGQHVNRAARIEPVTVRGCVYASEPFAAALTVAAPARFACHLVGVQALAKNYDRCPLYHVTRA